ncbi:MAG TPA: hypothetical protein PLU65_08385, partial [Dokdonella sp.]|nr:hypothetical protein [Dokdonella sp.]
MDTFAGRHPRFFHSPPGELVAFLCQFAARLKKVSRREAAKTPSRSVELTRQITTLDAFAGISHGIVRMQA